MHLQTIQIPDLDTVELCVDAPTNIWIDFKIVKSRDAKITVLEKVVAVEGFTLSFSCSNDLHFNS
jgi:hypothetical protein